MKLYFAGAEHFHKELHAANVKHVLISLANGKSAIPHTPVRFGTDARLIIDSGAFSYFQKKTTMSAEAWLRKLEPVLPFGHEVIALDIIGDAAKTWANYLVIREALPNVIPTFHVGSDLSFLKRYCDCTDRIAIGGMVPLAKSPEKLVSLVAQVFALFSPSTLPRLHAFGVFQKTILENFPFCSADASSWISGSKYNRIEYPMGNAKALIRSMDMKIETLRNVPLKDAVLLAEYKGYERVALNIKRYQELERYLTQLWQKRGITWNE